MSRQRRSGGMELFGTLRDDPIISRLHLERSRALRAPGARAAPDTGGALTLSTDRGVTLGEADLRDQFLVFQFSDREQGPRILESSQVEPRLKGSDENPDIFVRLHMVAFHVGASEEVDRNVRATLRIDFGKDENSNSPLDTLFWSIAAGLNLYNEAHGKRSEPKELKADFHEAFAKRPIEIPGGLGRLSFEVVKHQEPQWWRKIFGFLKGETARTLAAAIGFPAITTQAIDLLDQLLNRLDQDEPAVLFRSRPMTLALTDKAKRDVTGDIPGVSAGVLNPGYCLLARGRDFATIVARDPKFLVAYGKLVPGETSLEEFLAQGYDDPFEDMTYAVFRVAARETRLNQQLVFGG